MAACYVNSKWERLWGKNLQRISAFQFSSATHRAIRRRTRRTLSRAANDESGKNLVYERDNDTTAVDVINFYAPSPPLQFPSLAPHWQQHTVVDYGFKIIHENGKKFQFMTFDINHNCLAYKHPDSCWQFSVVWCWWILRLEREKLFFVTADDSDGGGVCIRSGRIASWSERKIAENLKAPSEIEDDGEGIKN